MTVVTTAFREPARLHAAALGVPDLPLVVLPHPVGDLPPAEVKTMAQAAYPAIVAALTEKTGPTPEFAVDYQLPATRQ